MNRDDDTTDEPDDGPPATPSRRGFLRGSASLAAIGLGAPEIAARRSAAEERCEPWDEFELADGAFLLMNNQWSTETPDQCVVRNDDGSYGWRWDHATGSGGPNYPEVLLGAKPWGTTTDTEVLPRQIGDIAELDVALDADVRIDRGTTWNLALEWWLMDAKPEPEVQKGDAITHEIMTVLDHGSGHGHGGVVERRAFTDAYGTDFDYWTYYDFGWNYHVFRTSDAAVPDRIDFTAHLEYLREEVDDSVGFADDLWMSGLEVGTEYWGGTAGAATVDTFATTVDGVTERSGRDDGDEGGDDPPATLLVDDFADWPGENALGRWTDGGAFERATVTDGRLRLEYDDAGWFASNVRQSVSDYERLELDVVGDSGGEEADVQLEVGGVEGPLADLTEDSITTEVSTLAVDLTAVGVDRSMVDDVAMSFFRGGSGAIEVDEIRFAAGSGGDEIPPDSPAPVSVTDAGQTELGIEWTGVSDAGGSGLARYVVSVDGVRDAAVDPETTTLSLTDLAPDTVYEVAVVAEDAAGNRSTPATVRARTDPAPDDGAPGDALVVNDYDGDPAWPRGNDLGNWNGAGGFANGGSGRVVDGALRLEYEAAGWLVEQVFQDVSDYDRLVLRVRGDDGGEETDFRLELGGAGGLLADVAEGSIGTEFGDVSIDLDATGVDPTAPGELRLSFWEGATGAVEIDEFRFE